MMFKLNLDEWNTLYTDYTGEINKEIRKQKQSLKEEKRSDLYKQGVYNSLNGLYIQKATVDDLNDYVMSKITEKACKDDEVGIKQVTRKIYELDKKLSQELEETLDKLRRKTVGYIGQETLNNLVVHVYELEYGMEVLFDLERLILEKEDD